MIFKVAHYWKGLIGMERMCQGIGGEVIWICLPYGKDLLRKQENRLSCGPGGPWWEVDVKQFSINTVLPNSLTSSNLLFSSTTSSTILSTHSQHSTLEMKGVWCTLPSVGGCHPWNSSRDQISFFPQHYSACSYYYRLSPVREEYLVAFTSSSPFSLPFYTQ
jgi:hypothetical protein